MSGSAVTRHVQVLGMVIHMRQPSILKEIDLDVVAILQSLAAVVSSHAII
jgi:hypothetical protein